MKVNDMKKDFTKKCLSFAKFMLALFIMLVVVFKGLSVKAASADISFETAQTNVEVGDIVTVEMVITSDVYPGDFEGYIQYSADNLTYISGPEVISGGEGILRINDIVSESDRNTRKYVLKFRAVGMGVADVSMRKEPSLYEFESGYLMSVSYNTLRFMVSASEQASSDATLKSLKISPGKLEPAFDNSTKEYTTSVGNNVTSLVVSAVCNSEEASVSVEGNENLVEGQNRIVIRVKSEDGNENKFVIYCVREKAASDVGENGDDMPTPTPEQEIIVDNSEHYMFYATENDGKIFITSDTRYELVEEDESLVIPKGFTRTSIIISDIKVPVYSPADDLSSDFLLMVLKKNGGAAGLYRYDRAEKTIQRFVSTDVVYKNEEQTSENVNNSELELKYNKSVSTLTTIIAVLCGICVVLLIVVIRFAIANKTDKDDLD